MNRYTSTMAIALLWAGFGTAALAQNAPATSPNPGKTQTAPTKSDVQQQQAQPSNETMDSNAQRAQSRSSGSTQQSSSKPRTAQANAGEVRDWNAIDKNHDHLISPEEMEAALKPTGSQANKSTPKR